MDLAAPWSAPQRFHDEIGSDPRGFSGKPCEPAEPPRVAWCGPQTPLRNTATPTASNALGQANELGWRATSPQAKATLREPEGEPSVSVLDPRLPETQLRLWRPLRQLHRVPRGPTNSAGHRTVGPGHQCQPTRPAPDLVRTKPLPSRPPPRGRGDASLGPQMGNAVWRRPLEARCAKNPCQCQAVHSKHANRAPVEPARMTARAHRTGCASSASGAPALRHQLQREGGPAQGEPAGGNQPHNRKAAKAQLADCRNARALALKARRHAAGRNRLSRRSRSTR